MALHPAPESSSSMAWNHAVLLRRTLEMVLRVWKKKLVCIAELTIKCLHCCCGTSGNGSTHVNSARQRGQTYLCANMKGHEQICQFQGALILSLPRCSCRLHENLGATLAVGQLCTESQLLCVVSLAPAENPAVVQIMSTRALLASSFHQPWTMCISKDVELSRALVKNTKLCFHFHF